MYHGIGTIAGTILLFQPFIFELFICVSDLFFGLCLISVRPLVNLLVALHFAAMQLKVLF